VKSHGDTVSHRQTVDELLRQIDDQRRRQLLLEASGVYAPGLEQEAERTRQELADLVR
jgi:hypothetical protein